MTMNISRRTALKTAAAAGALSVTGMPAMAAPKHGGTYTIGMSGGNTSDTWDSRTHSDSFMINMGAGCVFETCLLYTSPSPRDAHESRMPSSA